MIVSFRLDDSENGKAGEQRQHGECIFHGLGPLVVARSQQMVEALRAAAIFNFVHDSGVKRGGRPVAVIVRLVAVRLHLRSPSLLMRPS